ncbi:MAG: MFS transporter [Clostridia bacterium]|nr:MFS transporter [Clostridia bacterium]
MDKTEIPEKTYGIKMKDRIGYALGDTGGLMTFSLISSFQQMFYTDVLKIEPKRISTLMIVARIWDAINDPLWGGFIDSRKPTKYGRFRPYILGAAVPLAIAAVLMFTQIPGLTPAQYLIFAYVTYIFYGMMYTGTNIPYGSLASVITTDEIERSSLSMWRSIGAGVGGVPGTMLLPMVVYSVDAATGAKYLDGHKMTMAVAVLAALSVGIYFAHFKMTKERVSLPPKQTQGKFDLTHTVKALLKNRPFLILCVVSMLLIAFQMYTQTNYNYLLKNYYNRPELYSFVTVFTYLPMALFIPLMSRLIKKFGKKEICAYGLAAAALVNIVMFAIKSTSVVQNPYVFLALLFLSGAGQTFLVLEVWALVMDVIDYHELISGRREEGTSYAFFSFTRKLGQTVAGAGSAALLQSIGYDVNAAAQSAEVVKKLYVITTAIPAVALVIMFLLLQFAYPLSRAKLAEMKEKIAR